jgi:hypothetical protein
MEGAFEKINLEVEEVFEEKKRWKVCSFSGEEALKNPIMWGYYASGFRGIAIEIEIDPKKMRRINYSEHRPNLDEYKCLSTEEQVDKILTTKLRCWKHEDEYRYLKKSDESEHQIGKITKVYFGKPHSIFVPTVKTVNSSPIWQKYGFYLEELKSFFPIVEFKEWRDVEWSGEWVPKNSSKCT